MVDRRGLEPQGRECQVWLLPRLPAHSPVLAEVVIFMQESVSYRCGHPAQQHGRRMPLSIFERPFSTRIFLVPSILPEVIQQIHSFRASGVMASQTALAFGEPVSIFFTSAGATGCGTRALPFFAFIAFHDVLNRTSFPFRFTMFL